MIGNKMFRGSFGLEKENLRVTREGMLALTKRPQAFAMDNQYITTDFSESQVEMITPPCASIADVYDFMTNLHTIVSTNIGDELLWPQSNPPILPEDAAIPLAVFGDEEKDAYRLYLADKYGRKRTVLSGIHFNFSFDPAYIRALYQASGTEENILEFTNQLYIKVSKYVLKYRWLFIELFGASPIFHETYMPVCVSQSQQTAEGCCQIEHMQSLRNSCCGFRNDATYYIDYTNLTSYNDSVDALIASGQIQQAAELYTAVRLKGQQIETEIDYIELRFLDLNPLTPIGIEKTDLELLHLFLIYFANLPDFIYDQSAQELADRNQDYVAQPKTSEICIEDAAGRMSPLVAIGLGVLEQIAKFYMEYPTDLYPIDALLTDAKAKLSHKELTYSAQIKAAIESSDYIQFHLEEAKKYAAMHANQTYQLAGYETMELSTQIVIRAALKAGLTIEVLDRSAQFIRLSTLDRTHVEYVKEATKTSLDAYSQVLLMENKRITKQVLSEHQIAVPKGYVVTSVAEGLALYTEGLLPDGLVIKPNNTNFGKGITIYPQTYTEAELVSAITFALTEDRDILLEQFITGLEYRFLVIGGKVTGILHRRSANIIGDGVKSIQALVADKNKDPLRGAGYKTPLEYLHLGPIETAFLGQQGLITHSVPAKGQRIFLRENSNISTGGDSIDVTDSVDASYHAIALAAVAAVDVAISGVDMLIHDITHVSNESNHAIIELNFNPAIHIHNYPYKGENRAAGEAVIALLFPELHK